MVALDHSGDIHLWGKDGEDWHTKPKKVNGLNPVKDIAANIHGSLNVCMDETGAISLWGDWLGHHWKCPTAVSFPCIEQVFAVHGGLMCRPVVPQPEQRSIFFSALSSYFDTPVRALDSTIAMHGSRLIALLVLDIRRCGNQSWGGPRGEEILRPQSYTCFGFLVFCN